jgi:hypothetical protein
MNLISQQSAGCQKLKLEGWISFVYGNWLVLWPETDVYRLLGAVKKRFAVQCFIRIHPLLVVGKVRYSMYSVAHPPLVVEGFPQEHKQARQRFLRNRFLIDSGIVLVRIAGIDSSPLYPARPSVLSFLPPRTTIQSKNILKMSSLPELDSSFTQSTTAESTTTTQRHSKKWRSPIWVHCRRPTEDED